MNYTYLVLIMFGLVLTLNQINSASANPEPSSADHPSGRFFKICLHQYALVNIDIF